MKIKRNDPCICGSGKKFKKCCRLEHIISKFDDDYPIQFFGRIRSGSDPICMVSNITTLNKNSIEHGTSIEYPLGSWFVSFNNCNDIEIFGPFSRAEDGFDLARNARSSHEIKFSSY